MAFVERDVEVILEARVRNVAEVVLPMSRVAPTRRRAAVEKRHERPEVARSVRRGDEHAHRATLSLPMPGGPRS